MLKKKLRKIKEAEEQLKRDVENMNVQKPRYTYFMEKINTFLGKPLGETFFFKNISLEFII